jgi:hypothetical protein
MDFDEGLHQYSDGGVIIPSVTQIIHGLSSKPWFNAASSERGKTAHDLCAAYALDPVGFPSEPYVDAFAMWCFKRAPKWIAVEQIIEGEVDGLRYAGRIDGLAEIDGARVLLDLKTGVKSKTFYAQIGAYALATKPAKGLLLYLRDDLTYVEEWMSASTLALGIMEFRAAIKNYYA